MFSCKYCGKPYNSKYYNLLHEKTKHQRMTREAAKFLLLTCHKCDLSHNSYSEMTKHMATHDEVKTEFNCTECDKEYKSPTLLQKHINLLHKGMDKDESYFDLRICKVCDKMFTQPASLLKHLRNHTKAEIEKYKDVTKVIPIAKFNNEQIKFINSNIDDLCLVGIPGAGKSTSVAEYLSRKVINNDLRLDEFVILTFTNSVKDSFINKSKYYIRTKQHKKKLFTPKNVRTFHSLAGSLMSNIFGINTTINTVIVAVNHRLRLLEDPEDLYLCDPFGALKIIIVDEAQDMSSSQYNFILLLSKLLNVRIILVGDPNQSIFQFQDGSCEYMLDFITKPKTKTIKLVTNYRSTPVLVDFINSMKPLEDTVDMKSSIGGKETHKYPYIFMGTNSEIYSDLMKNLKKDMKDEKVDLSDVAVIGPVKLSKRGSLGLQTVVNLCNRYGIPYVRHYSDGSNNSFKYSIIKGKLNIITGHKSKGMEFEKTYVLNFNLKMQNRIPDLKKYNELKYLAYVMISRAKSSLKIYSTNGIIWPEIFKMKSHLYNSNRKIIEKKFKLAEEDNDMVLKSSVCKFIENLSAENEYDLLQLIDFEKTKTYNLYDSIDIETLNINGIHIPMFAGIVIENIFEMFYSEKVPSVIDKTFRIMISNTICLEKKYVYIYRSLQKKLNIRGGIINLEDIKKNKDSFNDKEMELINYIYKNINGKNIKYIYIVALSDLIFVDDKLIKDLTQEFELNINIIKKINKIQTIDDIEDIKENKKIDFNKFEHLIETLIKILFYKYQTDYQHGTLWDNETFNIILDYILPLIPQIIDFTKFVRGKYKKLTFQTRKIYDNIEIEGIIDCVDTNGIYDIKFSKNSNSFRYKMQLLLYHGLLDPTFKKKMKHGIWNIRRGEIIEFDFKVKNIWKLYNYLAQFSELKLNRMIFCYDLETTGTHVYKDQIIERYVRELNTGCVVSTGCIRGPIISEFISNLTGITQKMINKGNPLSTFRKEIKTMVSVCNKPIMMAHNGTRFDMIFIQRMSDRKTFSKITFLDSLSILRIFCKTKMINYKLETLHNYFIKKNKIQDHRAKGDVIMLIDILEHLKIDYKTLIKG